MNEVQNTLKTYVKIDKLIETKTEIISLVDKELKTCVRDIELSTSESNINGTIKNLRIELKGEMGSFETLKVIFNFCIK